ncbi:MAG: hypothetical protein DYG88_12395 [Chloroflexi bacterium CFX4]|nr:hypothetical protein [Chloroflexi bacterium CFX4]MDL1923169.1 hypothetical protein [Chloroflexi bacterium CFX3]
MSDSPRLAELGDMTLAELMAMVRELVQRELATYSKPKGYTEPTKTSFDDFPILDVGEWNPAVKLDRGWLYSDD